MLGPQPPFLYGGGGGIDSIMQALGDPSSLTRVGYPTALASPVGPWASLWAHHGSLATCLSAHVHINIYDTPSPNSNGLAFFVHLSLCVLPLVPASNGTVHFVVDTFGVFVLRRGRPRPRALSDKTNPTFHKARSDQKNQAPEAVPQPELWELWRRTPRDITDSPRLEPRALLLRFSTGLAPGASPKHRKSPWLRARHDEVQGALAML